MGKVFTEVTVINRTDQVLFEDGTLTADQVRSIQLEHVLVVPRVTTLCLPPDLIQQLGLRSLREVDISTANGFQTTRIFRDATLSLHGREGTFECIESPGHPLLGGVPLRMLGLEPDWQNQVLRVLPERSPDTYLTIL
jgi:hypothetical protein